MENTKLLINGITHLTDARYFAAIGAEWLTFIIDYHNEKGCIRSSVALELKNWISGPRIVLELNHINRVEWGETCKLIGPDALIINHINDFSLAAQHCNSILYRHQSIEAFITMDHNKMKGFSQHLIPLELIEIQQLIDSDNYAIFQHCTILQLNRMQDYIELESKTKTKPFGIALSGTMQLDTGMQDYSQWDELMDTLGMG